MMLKCADIGHLAAAPANHKRWAYQLEEEFFQQVVSFLRHLLLDSHYPCWRDSMFHLFRCCMGVQKVDCIACNEKSTNMPVS